MSLIRIRHLSAMLWPVVGAGAGLASFFWFHGGTVSHGLVGVGTDVITHLGIAVALSIVVGVGLGTGAGFSFRLVFGFGIAIALSCLPGCRGWCFSDCFGPRVWVRSASIEASRPTPSVSGIHSSLWSGASAATSLATMSMMPMPHSTSSR